MAGRAPYPYGSQARAPSRDPRRADDSDEEQGSDVSDEEAATLQRIKSRGSSRRTPQKREAEDREPARSLKKPKDGPPPELESDDWVACDRCNKWRLLRKDVFQRTVRENEPWYCELNYGRPGASCQDMDDEQAQAQEAEPEPAPARSGYEAGSGADQRGSWAYGQQPDGGQFAAPQGYAQPAGYGPPPGYAGGHPGYYPPGAYAGQAAGYAPQQQVGFRGGGPELAALQAQQLHQALLTQGLSPAQSQALFRSQAMQGRGGPAAGMGGMMQRGPAPGAYGGMGPKPAQAMGSPGGGGGRPQQSPPIGDPSPRQGFDPRDAA